jgi:hypothetical protein
MDNLVPTKYINSRGSPDEIFGDNIHVTKRKYKSLRKAFKVNGLCADVFFTNIWEKGVLLEHKTNGDIAHAFDQIMETAICINKSKKYTNEVTAIILESDIKKNFRRTFSFREWKDDKHHPKRKILHLFKGGKWKPQLIANNKGRKLPIFDKSYYSIK